MMMNTGPIGVTQSDVDEQAALLLEGVVDGEPLSELDEAFIALGVRASATAMDVVGTRAALQRARELGASPEQLHEAIELVAGMGVHTFFEASRSLDELVNDEAPPRSFDAKQQRLWDRYVGDGTYWQTMEEEVPGFLASLLRRSPAAFEAFFEFCAVPWRSGHVSSAVKELMSAAVDATPSHRYLPGLRLHLRNALKLGAGRLAVERTIAIAAHAPVPHGVR